MTRAAKSAPRRDWKRYYRWTAGRPPRELLSQVLNHLEWEGRSRPGRTAIDLGFGAGTDTLELLRRGWKVVAIDAQAAAAAILERRVPARLRESLTCLVAPMEDVELPPADLIYASYSLPFCGPDKLPAVWSKIRRAVRPGGHFAGQLFGEDDEWSSVRDIAFYSATEVRRMSRGFKLELFRETVEEGRSLNGAKHWHVFEVILGKPPLREHRNR